MVGAPQYFEKDGEIGGAVYVYINKAGNWNQAKATRIDGPKDSMFGLAVENLGDINQDGYQGKRWWGGPSSWLGFCLPVLVRHL